MGDGGWYPDPGDTGQVRYWDGAAWTEHRAPAPAAPPSSVGRRGTSGIDRLLLGLSLGGLLLVVVFFVAYLALAIKSENDAARAGPTTSSVPAVNPRVLSGLGAGTTPPFGLDAGTYRVHFAFAGACHYIGRLGSEGLRSRELGRGPGPLAGDVTLEYVGGGDHFVEISTGPEPGCPWSVTLTRS